MWRRTCELVNLSGMESFSREYTSTCEEYRTEITSLNGHVLPNHKTQVTDSQALQESLGSGPGNLSDSILAPPGGGAWLPRESWQGPYFSPNPPCIQPGNGRWSRCNHKTLSHDSDSWVNDSGAWGPVRSHSPFWSDLGLPRGCGYSSC